MRKILILFGIILCIALNAQVPGSPDANGTITAGPPFIATGISTGGGEMTLQLQYIQGGIDSLRTFIDPSDSSAIFTIATITVLDYDPPHGAMSFSDSAAVIALTQNNWNKITNAENDLFTVQDADDLTIAGDTVTIEIDGDYVLNWSLSFSGSALDVYQIAVYKNSVIESITMSRSTSQTDVGNMSLPVYIENLVAGDDLSFYIRNTGDNDDPTLVSSSVVVYMLHPD